MRNIIWVIGGVVMILLIGYGGPYLTKKYIESYKRTINKNGVFLDGTIKGKNGHKGHAVIFTYTYKGRNYSNSENNYEYYNNLEIGAEIRIVLDSLHPENAYIFATR